jgi:hypothetical protein
MLRRYPDTCVATGITAGICFGQYGTVIACPVFQSSLLSWDNLIGFLSILVIAVGAIANRERIFGFCRIPMRL